MGTLLKFSIVLPLICALIVYLKPNLPKEGLNAFTELRSEILSSLLTSDLFDFENIRFDEINAEESKAETNVKPKPKPKPKLRSKVNPKCAPKEELLFTPDELKQYDGREGSHGLYLAYLGVVYDVSKGEKHYGPNGGYSFFAGKDGSRAFITGEFNEKGLVDDVEGLSIDSFGGVREWAQFYSKDYIKVGRVVGSYYNSEGCPTSKIDYLNKMYSLYDKQREAEAEETKRFPPCNSEWSGETNITRVWCSKMSGGIERDWVGVPRKLFIPGRKLHRCACIRPGSIPSFPSIDYADEEDLDGNKNTVKAGSPRIEEYEGCDKDSHECVLKDE